MASFMATMGLDATGMIKGLNMLPHSTNAAAGKILASLNKSSQQIGKAMMGVPQGSAQYNQYVQALISNHDKMREVERRLDVEGATRRNQTRALLRQRGLDQERKLEEAHARSLSGRVGKFFGGVAGQFVGIGAAIGAIYKTKEFIADSIRVNIQMQQMFNTLKSVSGSAAQARNDMEFLRSESDRVGFSFLESGRNFARFSVAAKASGMAAQATRKVFIAVQEAATVMGLTTDQTGASMLALEQMLSKGTVMSQELRLQLGNAMPGAINIFANALGIGIEKLYEMVEGGLVPAKEAVELFGLEVKKAFTLTPEANKTIRDITRMTNAINDMKNVIGQDLAPEVERVAGGIGLIASAYGGGDDLEERKNIRAERAKVGDPARWLFGLQDEKKEDPALMARLEKRKVELIELEQKEKRAALFKKSTNAAAEKEAEKILKLEDELAKKHEETTFKAMTREQQIQELLRKRSDIFQAGMMTGKSGRLQAGIDIEEIDQQLAALRGEKPAKIARARGGMGLLSTEQSHGLFGVGLGGINNPVLSETRTTNQILRAIRQAVEKANYARSTRRGVNFGGGR